MLSLMHDATVYEHCHSLSTTELAQDVVVRNEKQMFDSKLKLEAH